MDNEDKIINELLNPILGESMNASLEMFLEMKNQGQIIKGDTEVISFLNLFLEDALEYYSSTNNIEKQRIIFDLKQYLSELI